MRNECLKLVFLIHILVQSLWANPVRERYFSEFLIDSTGWIFELNSMWGGQIDLDSCFLSSNTHKTFFKSGLFIDHNYLLIAQDSLQSTFYIDPFGDEITLYMYRPDSMFLDRLSFGPREENEIVAPSLGQSICLNRDWLYLDNSPTLGQPNDTLNAMGIIKGSVTDDSGMPIDSIEAYWDYGTLWPEQPLNLDIIGQFSLHVLAAPVTFLLQKENYKYLRKKVQAYPESTITINLIMERNLNVVDDFSNISIDEYILINNYPNPFNSSTIITYQIPFDDYIEISIYDVNGKLIENLHSGFQKQGKYSLLWDAFSVPSGIYIYTLRSSRMKKNKKCLLIK